MKRYDHRTIEQRAREKWEKLGLHATDLARTDEEPYYLLFEFPYPSGDLHIGHWYAFAVTDIFARYLKARGKNVLFPIGFDSFGLPAENAAMKNGADPKNWTYKNMNKMRAQIRSMGTMVDWSKEVVTSDPEYYRWTQWLFGKFFEQGLAERKEAAVKWCPKDETVLANEQVVDGRCERCGTEVAERRLTQWFLKITQYAERLLQDLDGLPWPEEIKQAQRAWIGKSEGAKLRFDLTPGFQGRTLESIEVFTTRPDTIFGATYVVVAPELAQELIQELPVENAADVSAYIETTKKKTERERQEEKEKTGVELKGVKAVNPATKEEIPVFVADYVLGSYGTGAVMAVPAHDERDFEFAKKFGLPIVEVVDAVPPLADEFYKRTSLDQKCYTGSGLLKNSGEFNGRDNQEATGDIVTFAGGEKATQYRIRDWLVSRQRYWGCPIPVVYDPEGKPHLVPAEHLPWLLPTDVSFKTGGDLPAQAGKSPLASSKELPERVERLFGKGWTPEYDTLDTFVDSSWYFLRYLAPHDENEFSDADMMKKWLPVNRYSGGSEHTTMHLLYARFFHKALYDLALVPTPEPFYERFNRGIILGTDGQKMSKRWGNVVNPDEVVKEFGTDAVRLYLAFIGPYNEPGHYPWKLDGVAGMRRFLDRVYALSEKIGHDMTNLDTNASRGLAKAAKKVSEDCERFKFNTALSTLMILVRELESASTVPVNAYRDLLIMLAPFAPHLVEHLWEKSEGEGSVHQAPWPSYDPKLLESGTASVVVQVGGRKRGSIALADKASEAEALAEAMKLESVQSALDGKKPKRVIYVPGRILNLVV